MENDRGPEEPEAQLAVPDHTTGEMALDTAAVLANLIPGLGAAIGAILSGQAADWRQKRVLEVVVDLDRQLKGLVQRMDGLSAEQEEYFRSEEFQELLTETLDRVRRERGEEKRRAYRRVLFDAIASPGQPYDEQLQMLRTIEDLQEAHVHILRAMLQDPPPSPTVVRSRMSTLQERLPDIPEEQLKELVAQLADQRIIDGGGLGAIVTARSAADLRPLITPYGGRLIRFIQEDEGDEG